MRDVACSAFFFFTLDFQGFYWLLFMAAPRVVLAYYIFSSPHNYSIVLSCVFSFHAGKMMEISDCGCFDECGRVFWANESANVCRFFRKYESLLAHERGCASDAVCAAVTLQQLHIFQ